MKQVPALLEKKYFPWLYFEIWEHVLWQGNLRHTIFKFNANPINQIFINLKRCVREMQKHITYVAAHTQTPL
jgi:hypothetical protein